MKTNPYQKVAKDSKEEMVLKHAPLIKRVVSRMAARFPQQIDRDELMQAGAIGLLDAVNKFDPAKEVKFKTYAEFRIRGAILDELRSMDWIPRSVRHNSHKLEAAFTKLIAKHGRDPKDSEMAKEMEMSLKDYQKFLGDSRPIPLVSIDNYSGGGSDDEAPSILEVLADPNVEDPFEKLNLNLVKENLAEVIKTLNENEQLLLALYYQEELNLKEIGEVLGVSESRVSQMRTKIIIKLRSKVKQIA